MAKFEARILRRPIRNAEGLVSIDAVNVLIPVDDAAKASSRAKEAMETLDENGKPVYSPASEDMPEKVAKRLDKAMRAAAKVGKGLPKQ